MVKPLLLVAETSSKLTTTALHLPGKVENFIQQCRLSTWPALRTALRVGQVQSSYHYVVALAVNMIFALCFVAPVLIESAFSLMTDLPNEELATASACPTSDSPRSNRFVGATLFACFLGAITGACFDEPMMQALVLAA